MFGGAGRYWENLRHQARNLMTDEPPEKVEILDMPQDAGVIDSLQEMSALSYQQRLMGFFATLGMGLFFIAIAVLLLPTVAIVPKKFAFFITTGNMFCLGSTTFLVGFRQQLRSIFDAKRLEAALVYIASVILTLVAALHWKSSLLSIIFAAIQVLCFLWYALSYVPFARSAVGVVSSHLWHLISFVVCAVSQALTRGYRFLLSSVR